MTTPSVHLLTSVAIQSVDFSVKSLFMPDSSGAFIKASLEMHALITSPSERFHIARCSMALQKQQIKNGKHPPFIRVQNKATICKAIFLF